MAFPIYSILEINNRSDELDSDIQEFSEFVYQLIEQDHWENPTEKGIISLIHSGGTSVLSPKQANVLNIIVARYDGKECRICGKSIPMSDVLYHEMNNGLCSNHKNQIDKEV